MKIKIKTILGIIATIFIIAGFGMTHAESPIVSTIANIAIGIGCLYLIYLLYSSLKDSQ